MQSIYFKNYRNCGYTCNPRKFEIPALRFPRKVPVNPCKHLQCRQSFIKNVRSTKYQYADIPNF